MKRKTAQDWKNEYKDAKSKVTRVETRITARLLELVLAHPDAPVALESNTVIKAKSLDNTFISHIDSLKRLEFIEKIETWLAEQHPHKQLNLYNDESKS
jgi:hypothetical protein